MPQRPEEKRRKRHEYYMRNRERIWGVGRGRKHKSSVLKENPDFKVDMPGGKYGTSFYDTITNGTGAGSSPPKSPATGYKKIMVDQTWRDKMNAAYADASYKQGRRAMRTGASAATTRKVLDKLQRERVSKIRGSAHRLELEKQRSYVTGKASLRSQKRGIIPRLISSYANNYKIGIKSIGRSALKLPSKTKKKLANFYNKWLKW